MAKAKETAADGLHDWQRAFKIKPDLREADVVALERSAAAIPHIILSATNSYREAYLAAAIEAGWIESPDTKWEEVRRKEDGREVVEKRYYYDGRELSTMHPGAVRWLGGQVIIKYNEVTAVPLAL